MLVKDLIAALQKLNPIKPVNIYCDSKMIGKYSVPLESDYVVEKVKEVQITYPSPDK